MTTKVKHDAGVSGGSYRLRCACSCGWVREFDTTKRNKVRALRAAQAHRAVYYVSWQPIPNAPPAWAESAASTPMECAQKNPAAWGASKVHRYAGGERGGRALCGAKVPPNNQDEYIAWACTEEPGEPHETEPCKRCDRAKAAG